MAVKRDKAERLADEELMPLIGAKDPEAFEVFYDRHGGVAYSLAYRIVGERAAAEDVTQEAFISIWRSGARFDRARGSVRSWMLEHRPQPGDRLPPQQAGKAPKLTFDDEAMLEQRPVRGADRGGGDAPRDRERGPRRPRPLPGEQSKVIELAYFGGFSQSEIARMLGRAAGHREGPDAAGAGEDQRRAGGGIWHERRRVTSAGARTSPPTCWARSSPSEATEFERHLEGCDAAARRCAG